MQTDTMYYGDQSSDDWQFVTIGGPDLDDPGHRADMEAWLERISRLESVGPFTPWYSVFQQWFNASLYPSRSAGLGDWLLDSGALGGAAFSGSMVLDGTGSIQAAAIVVPMTSPNTSAAEQQAMEDARATYDGLSFDAIVFTPKMIQWERTAGVVGLTLQSIGLAIAAVMVLTLLFLPPVESVLVTLCVAATNAELVGWFAINNIHLNITSLLYIILSIGFSVDYSAHVAESFARASGTRRERVCSSLGAVGVSVFKGGTSTLVAVVILAFSQSQTFQDLMMSFLGFVLLGLVRWARDAFDAHWLFVCRQDAGRD